uniref:Cytoplasmic tRNA 2-thiolation protein 2 n=1 Tax=Culex tarsalis TaxID=7177 RepID=A0A1Q3F147_CULTA
MCSIVEDDFGDEGGAHTMKEESPAPTSSTATDEELCRKCAVNPSILKLNLKEPQCRECFLHYVRHKFRASLGATKIVRRGSRVLIEFNGSAENVVMLDMIRYGLQQESFKKLRIDPVVVLVSEDHVGRDGGNRAEVVQEKLRILKQFEFQSYYSVIGAKDCVGIDDSDLLERYPEERARIIKILSGFKSATSKQDFITQTRKQTLKLIAKHLECPYIFLSDIGLDLAKTLLSNVALGRGRSLALDIAFCDDRDEQHKIIRPMRDLNPDEIENYLKHGENKLSYATLEDPFKDKPSLQNLTCKFVDGLQQTYPSTVSTVFRTGDKMSCEPIKSNETDDNQDLLGLFDKSLRLDQNATKTAPARRCKFCHSALDFHGSTTLFATEFSRMVSSKINVELSHEAIVESSKRMEEDARRRVNGDEDGGEGDENGMMQLRKELCHSCRSMFVEFDAA